MDCIIRDVQRKYHIYTLNNIIVLFVTKYKEKPKICIYPFPLVSRLIIINIKKPFLNKLFWKQDANTTRHKKGFHHFLQTIRESMKPKISRMSQERDIAHYNINLCVFLFNYLYVIPNLQQCHFFYL